MVSSTWPVFSSSVRPDTPPHDTARGAPLNLASRGYSRAPRQLFRLLRPFRPPDHPQESHAKAEQVHSHHRDVPHPEKPSAFGGQVGQRRWSAVTVESEAAVTSKHHHRQAKDRQQRRILLSYRIHLLSSADAITGLSTKLFLKTIKRSFGQKTMPTKIFRCRTSRNYFATRVCYLL